MKTASNSLNLYRSAPRSALLLALLLLAATPAIFAQTAQPPVLTGVTGTQRAGTGGASALVDISYTISDANFTNVNVFVLVSKDSGATWTVPATTFTGAYGTNISVTATPTGKTMTWNAGADWGGNYTANCRVRVLANNVGLVLIPQGSYTRGNSIGDSDITDAPAYPVYVSAFYMDQNLVSGALWNLVIQTYATTNGYTFVNAGSFKAASHPVQTIDWFDAVKWCNARSEREGLTPVYYTDAAFTSVYRTGEVFVPYWKPGANGYRLPTEAEWEKAARGGASGHRFPWSDADTISGSRGNYLGNTSISYDLGPNGYNASYTNGAQPYTSPVGSFAPNAYYLYDMAGNVFEFCWDWYGSSYYTVGQSDPQGPAQQGAYRVARGGTWGSTANYARCALRLLTPPALVGGVYGFRCARGL